MPVLNINTKLNNQFKLNVKLGTRQVLFRDGDSRFTNELFDISPILSSKIGLNNSIAAGYLLRFRDGKLVHRAIQQFAINRRYTSFRLTHLLSSDQTCVPDQRFDSFLETKLRTRSWISFSWYIAM